MSPLVHRLHLRSFFLLLGYEGGWHSSSSASLQRVGAEDDQDEPDPAHAHGRHCPTRGGHP